MPKTQHITSVEYQLIKGFPGYRVGTDGSVWTLHRLGCRGGIGTIWRRLQPWRHADGYFMVALKDPKDSRAGSLCFRKKYVHRLMLELFVGPCPPGMECCHYDGDPANNALTNLRWDTTRGNSADGIRLGRSTRGSRHPGAKLTEADIPKIRRLRRSGVSPFKIADQFGVCYGTIRGIMSGKFWSHVPG